LLLAQPVLLVVLIKVILTPDPPLLRKGCPIPLLLLRGATSGLRPRRRQVRSGGMDGHQLWTEIARTNEKRETRTKKGRKTVLTDPALGSITYDQRSSSLCGC
jgi:hypothetical protein